MPRLTEAAFNKHYNVNQNSPGNGEASKTGVNGQQENAPRWRRSAFVDLYTTGQEIDTKGKPVKQETSMYVDFAPETMEQYANWLGTYADHLRRIRDTNPTFWESELNKENRDLLSRIQNQDGSAPEQSKINEYLNTSEGKLKTTEVMAKNAELIYNANGLRLDFETPQKSEKKGLFGRGRNVVRSLRDADIATVSEKLKDAKSQAAISGAGAGLGGLIADRYTDKPLLVGAAGGALMGAAVAPKLLSRMRTLRRGDPIPLKKDPLVFERIRQDPQLKEYVQNVLELNVDTFRIDRATGTVIPPETDQDSEHVKKILKRADGTFHSVREFNRALGADATTGRHLIFKDRFTTTIGGDQMELNRVSQEKFKEKLKSLPDKWGQSEDHPCYLRADCSVGSPELSAAEALVAPGTPGEAQVNNARANAQKEALDARVARGEPRNVNTAVREAADRAAQEERDSLVRHELKKQVHNVPVEKDNYFDRTNSTQVEERQLEMLSLYDKAEFEAGVQLTAQKIQEKQQQEAKDELEKDSTFLNAKKNALDSGGSLTTEQKEAHKTKQEEIQHHLDDVQSDIEVYDAKHEAEKAIQEAEDTFYQEFTDPDMDAAEKRISDMLDTNDPGSIRARRMDIESRVDAEYKALLKSKFGDPIDYKGYNNEEIKIAQAEFSKAARGGVLGEEADQLRQDEEKLISERSRLREIKQTINQKKREIAGSDVSKNVEDLQKSLQKSMNEIVGWGSADLTPHDLATRSYEELVRRVNELHRTDSSKGWAKVLNDDPDKRQKLLHAMLEARGVSEETRSNVPGSDFEVRKARYDVIGPGGYWNLSDEQLRLLSRDEILNILTEKDRRLGIVGPKAILPTLDQIDSAKEYAQKKVSIREQETQKLKSDLERQKESESVSERGVENTNKERQERINEIIRIRQRATQDDSLFGKTDEITENFFDYTKTSAVPAKDTPEGREYADDERSYGAPEGYYTWLQFITNYQSDEAIPDRQVAFQKAKEVIPKEMLAYVLNEQLSLGISGDPTIEQALDEVKKRGSTSQSQSFEVVRGVMRRLTEEAKSL